MRMRPTVLAAVGLLLVVLCFARGSSGAKPALQPNFDTLERVERDRSERDSGKEEKPAAGGKEYEKLLSEVSKTWGDFERAMSKFDSDLAKAFPELPLIRVASSVTPTEQELNAARASAEELEACAKANFDGAACESRMPPEFREAVKRSKTLSDMERERAYFNYQRNRERAVQDAARKAARKMSRLEGNILRASEAVSGGGICPPRADLVPADQFENVAAACSRLDKMETVMAGVVNTAKMNTDEFAMAGRFGSGDGIQIRDKSGSTVAMTGGGVFSATAHPMANTDVSDSTRTETVKPPDSINPETIHPPDSTNNENNKLAQGAGTRHSLLEVGERGDGNGDAKPPTDGPAIKAKLDAVGNGIDAIAKSLGNMLDTVSATMDTGPKAFSLAYSGAVLALPGAISTMSGAPPALYAVEHVVDAATWQTSAFTIFGYTAGASLFTVGAGGYVGVGLKLRDVHSANLDTAYSEWFMCIDDGAVGSFLAKGGKALSGLARLHRVLPPRLMRAMSAAKNSGWLSPGATLCGSLQLAGGFEFKPNEVVELSLGITASPPSKLLDSLRSTSLSMTHYTARGLVDCTTWAFPVGCMMLTTPGVQLLTVAQMYFNRMPPPSYYLSDGGWFRKAMYLDKQGNAHHGYYAANGGKSASGSGGDKSANENDPAASAAGPNELSFNNALPLGAHLFEGGLAAALPAPRALTATELSVLLCMLRKHVDGVGAMIDSAIEYRRKVVEDAAAGSPEKVTALKVDFARQTANNLRARPLTAVKGAKAATLLEKFKKCTLSKECDECGFLGTCHKLDGKYLVKIKRDVVHTGHFQCNKGHCAADGSRGKTPCMGAGIVAFCAVSEKWNSCYCGANMDKSLCSSVTLES